MEFTYDRYVGLIELLRAQGFSCSRFQNGPNASRPVYLRHDIDLSIGDALSVAELEAEHGVVSTYYVMLDTELYNVSATVSKNQLRAIAALGHDIGLHYVQPGDNETNGDFLRFGEEIRWQSRVLADVLELPVKSFSYHRPTPHMLDANIAVADLVNAYMPPFFMPGAYISDSNHHWRCGDPATFIANFDGQSLQMLTHPFWWNAQPTDPVKKLKRFLDGRHKSHLTAIIRDVKLARDAFEKT